MVNIPVNIGQRMWIVMNIAQKLYELITVRHLGRKSKINVLLKLDMTLPYLTLLFCSVIVQFY